MNRSEKAFWTGKRVLLTGHTGFKGSWLAIWLHRLGADVTGISLPPDQEPNLFSLADVGGICDSYFSDIRDHGTLVDHVRRARPEIVFHLAAQALVRRSYRDPVATFSTNVMGTAHLLDSLRDLANVKVAVLVTTDKVYQNREWLWPYREDDALGGHDPYSASKAASELVISSYREAYLSAQDLAVASARAGNVIGGGDWSEDRLIPDAIRAWQSDQLLHIRRPHAVRPWQHVLEPLTGYMRLARALWEKPELSGAYNFGPETRETMTVRDVIEIASCAYGDGKVSYANNSSGPHEATNLALETAKARQILGYRPRWDLSTSVGRTIAWYQSVRLGENAKSLCERDIQEFEASE
jgi:CDP-glucose 4,6-dehydratase